MLVFPNAKINLGLNVISKRNDGFHNIESVMFPVDLCDILEFIPVVDARAKQINLSITGLNLDSDLEDNLLIKTYNLLAEDYDIPALDIHLHKIIPFGAGLGGGSSDAAFFIKALNEEFSLNISNKKLKELSAKIGSDCPFFIDNKPVFASGKGEEMQAVDFSLAGYYLFIVSPKIMVSTKFAYSSVRPSKPEISIDKLLSLPIETWKENIKNDFEDSIFKYYPEIKGIKLKLYQSGALYASMTGSGSSVFGIFKSAVMLKDSFKDYFVWQEEIKKTE